MKRKFFLIIILLISIFAFNMDVKAGQSSNYFNCSNSQYQCISCTYNKATYYAKSDGKGNVSVAWETGDNSIAKAGTSKHFCNSNECSSLVCPSNIYMYPEMKGRATNNVYVIDSPDAQYQSSVSLSGSTDNKKPFLSSSGGKYSPLKCQYYTYTFGHSSTPNQSSHKNFVVSMDADGNFSMTYDGNPVSNASTLVGKGNITQQKFSSGTCPELYVSCNNSNGSYICAANTEPFYNGAGNPSGEQEGSKKSDKKSEQPVATPEDNGRVGENFCSEEEVVTALKALGIFIMIAKFAIPMIIIALGTWDLVKAITAGTEDTLKKQITSLIVRAVVGLAVLFAPTIANAVLSGLNQYNVISDDINECQNCLLNPLTEGKCAGSDNNKTVDAGDLNYDKSVDAGDLNYNKSADAGDLNYNKSADAGDLNYNKSADAGDLNYNKNASADDLNYNKSASGDLNYNKDASAGDLNNNKNVSTGETNNNKNVNVGETQQPSNVVQTGKTTNPTNRVNSN